MKKLMTISLMISLLAAGAASAKISNIDISNVNVDIYAGFQEEGSGTPYSGFVGSFSSSDVMFGAVVGWDWHPFNMSGFGADITGILDVAADDAYYFTLESDDGSKLFIDGTLVIDNGNVHAPEALGGTRYLSAGSHSFEVQFFENGDGPSGVDLYVPEPATMCLLGLGALGLVRRKKVA